MNRPFRFGVTSGSAQSHTAWVELARKAEALGYSTILVPDRTAANVAPFTALSIAAQATSKLRVGTYVLVNDYRHPALVAKEIAMLDVLSEGRVELGIGVGNFVEDFKQLGIPFDSPGTRIARLEESLQVMLALFTGEEVTFKGKYYTIEGMRGIPKPVQQPHPPILIGGAGRRLLELGARYVDILGIGPSRNPQGTTSQDAPAAEKIEWVRQAAGARFDSIELNQGAFSIEINDSTPITMQQRFGPPRVPVSLEQAIEQLQADREQYGFSYIQVGEHQIENFAPVVARLAGR
jgi:probable F420-dependent oxidoreductase